MGFGYKIASMLMILVGSFVSEALATQHVVGGSQGWDESTDFKSWASSQTFKVGDQLVFKYTSMHSVVELGSEKEYKNCDIGNAINSLNGGNNVIKLNKPGTRYFACGTSGHCDQGMKVKVTTVSKDAASGPASSTPTSSTSTSSTTTATSTSNAHVFVSLSSMGFVIVLSVFNFFFGY